LPIATQYRCSVDNFTSPPASSLLDRSGCAHPRRDHGLRQRSLLAGAASCGQASAEPRPRRRGAGTPGCGRCVHRRPRRGSHGHADSLALSSHIVKAIAYKLWRSPPRRISEFAAQHKPPCLSAIRVRRRRTAEACWLSTSRSACLAQLAVLSLPGIAPQCAADAAAAIHTLRGFGIDAANHQPRNLSQVDVASFEVVVALDPVYAAYHRYPGRKSRLWKIPDRLDRREPRTTTAAAPGGSCVSCESSKLTGYSPKVEPDHSVSKRVRD
jgi:hypothetical protein